ncbi:hypothetical protein FQA39_LY08305 [Lamprigera yunnana]|nr:hypothetical protein FQA39_LY08305 [Lamprigera yunnana]
MNTSRQNLSPNKLERCTVLNKSLILKDNERKLKQSLFYGACNSCLLALFAYDILHTSPIYLKWVLYIEYILCLIFFLNLIYHIVTYIKISKKSHEHLKIDTSAMPEMESEHYGSFLSCSTKIPLKYDHTPTKPLCSTPIDTTALSWLSNASPPSFTAKRHTSSPFVPRNSPNQSFTYYESSGSEFIKDEESLVDYLKGYENYEKAATTGHQSEQSTNLLSTFWNRPAPNNMETIPLLKRCNYQLSPPEVAYSGPNRLDMKNSTINQMGIEVWKPFRVNNITLTQWNANLRMWISQTIVERLSKEFVSVDIALQKQGFVDVQIGHVSLERLRKTAQMIPVLQNIPNLSILISFLEVCGNQEYLVKRIKELSRGGCMSDFKWNSGSTFNGKEWNDSLPTDSEIIIHLFATYMDTQLLPLPNCPDTKPFTGTYYIKLSEEIPQSTTICIQYFSQKPPHFRILIGNEVYPMVQGYNNLFNTILFFLYQVNEREYGMLRGINLGKSGINILWVINQ